MKFKNQKTGEEISPVQVAELWDKGKIAELPYTFGDINTLTQQIHFYMQLKNGYKQMIIRSMAVVKRSYGLLMNPETNPLQRARCLYDIARFDMIPQAMIGFFGNRKLPKELESWKPKFGVQWHFKAMQEIARSDIQGNIFWQMEAQEIYEKEMAKLEAPRVKDISIEVYESRALMIGINGNETLYGFQELPEFWNNTSNCPNVNAHIMIDLSNDYEGLLKENCKTHKTFGINVKDAGKQLSKLCLALDSIVTTDSLDLTSINRWFLEIDKTDKQWKPKFNLISSRSKEERELIGKALEQNMKVPDMVDSLSQEQKDTIYMLKHNDMGRVVSGNTLEKEDKKAKAEQAFTD